MKKYFNKALMFQWFNSTKWIIGIGIIIWAFISNGMIRSNIYGVKDSIGYDFNNAFYSFDLSLYLPLGFIFMAIYYGSMGLNKKNINTFLYSGPNTKKSIKFNTLICMFITLLIFTAVYLYMIIMLYIGNRTLMTIINGYWTIMFIELSKMICFGVMGIILLMILDMLFINTMAAIVSMISIFPLMILLFVFKIKSILAYIPFKRGQSIMTYLISNKYILSQPYLCNYDIVNLRLKYLFINIISCIFTISILFIIFIIMEKRSKLENSIKLFSSKKTETFVTVSASFSIAVVIEEFLSIHFFIDRIYAYTNEMSVHSNILIIYALCEILLIIVITIFINILMKKMLNKLA